MKVKLCGVRTLADFELCVALNVAYVGVNLVPGVRRRCPEGLQSVMSTTPRGTTQLVGVVRDQPLGAVLRLVADWGLDAVQLHGQEQAAQWQEPLAQKQVMTIKAVSVGQAGWEQQLADWLGRCGVMLLDGAQPGHGQRAPAKLLTEAVARCVAVGQRYAIAGGLTPENIGLVRARWPRAEFYDTASGIEMAGQWAAERVEKFVSRAREA